MGITYTIDRERDVIRETWSGSIAARDLGDYWTRYLADPDVLALRRTLVDLRRATINFFGAELDALIHSIVEPKLAGRSWVTAVLVDDPVQYGVTRQYQVFAEHYSSDAIFTSEDNALDWLARQPLF